MEPLTLVDGETRTGLEDGHQLTLTGRAQGDGYRLGLNGATGQVLPAHT